MACGVDDLVYLGLALSAAGAGAQYAGQEKATKAADDKTTQELLRQQEIQRKARNEFDVSLAGSSKQTADRQIEQSNQERLNDYQNVQAVPIAAPNAAVVGGNSAALNLQDAAQRAASNRARAKLGSYDKWQLDQAVKNLRASQQQQMYGQEAQRSQAILPLELQDASHKGDSLKGLGMGLGALGSLVSLGSMAGVGAGTATASSGLMTPAQQAAFVATPVGATGYVAPTMGSTLFPSLARMSSGMSGLYGLNGKY